MRGYVWEVSGFCDWYEVKFRILENPIPPEDHKRDVKADELALCANIALWVWIEDPVTRISGMKSPASLSFKEGHEYLLSLHIDDW